ncbi:MAG: zinc dependent phospholipase C family protein [Thermoproteota archaeon]
MKKLIHFNKKILTILAFLLITKSYLAVSCYAWGNGGYSSSPDNPKYGTHDWIAEQALDWLPNEARQWVVSNLNWYLYGTELPDNGRAPDGIGDTNLHHVYFNAEGVLVDDSAARRANATFNQALTLMLSGDFASAAKYAGAMTHYIVDMAVFGHVMGAGTDWGAEEHHSDYENYVNSKTSSYNSEWSRYLVFDGELEIITAYEATVRLAYDTTFGNSGRGLTCVWMDRNYDWNNSVFVERVLNSINLAVNYVTDVLYTLYTTYAQGKQSPSGGGLQMAVVTFKASGLGEVPKARSILIVDNQSYGAYQLPVSFTWETGSTHAYRWIEFVESTVEDRRYRLDSVSGLSNSSMGFLTVPLGGGCIEASYRVQYRLEIGAEAGKGTTDPRPGVYWFDEYSVVNITAIPYSKYEFKMWRTIVADNVAYDRFSNPTSIWIGGPASLIAEFAEAFDYQVTLVPSSITLQKGKSTEISVYVERTAGEPRQKITLSIVGVPKGVSYGFLVDTDVPPIYTTLTLRASEDAPVGTHIITIRATYGENVREAPLSVTVIEPEKKWYEQPWITIIIFLAVIVIITSILKSLRRKA